MIRRMLSVALRIFCVPVFVMSAREFAAAGSGNQTSLSEDHERCTDNPAWTGIPNDINAHDCYDALAELRSLADFYDNYVYEFWSRELERPRFRTLRRVTPLSVRYDDCSIVIVPVRFFNPDMLPDLYHHGLPTLDLATYAEWHQAAHNLVQTCSWQRKGGWNGLGQTSRALVTLLLSPYSALFEALGLNERYDYMNTNLSSAIKLTGEGSTKTDQFASSQNSTLLETKKRRL